jgi:hypothetical protein
VRVDLGIPEKSDEARRAGSPGVFDVAGMSRRQQEYASTLVDGA